MLKHKEILPDKRVDLPVTWYDKGSNRLAKPKTKYHSIFGDFTIPAKVIRRKRKPAEIERVRQGPMARYMDDRHMIYEYTRKVHKHGIKGIMTVRDINQMVFPDIAKTDRSFCGICGTQILKGDVKIGYRVKIHFRSGPAMRGGWMCIACHYSGLEEHYKQVKKYVRACKRQANLVIDRNRKLESTPSNQEVQEGDVKEEAPMQEMQAA